MLKLMNIVISMVLVCLLSACASSMSNTAKNEDQNQKIKTAKINAQLGIAYLERHNLQRSKQKLLLALEQAPSIPETWYSMAYFLEATGNKDDASIYYQKAIAVAPKRGDAQNNYGTFLCRNGDYRGAVEHFMVAVKDPTYLDPADAYENAGLCALKIPDKAMATKYFAQALQQDPARTVSERKLRELNNTALALNDSTETGESLDENIPAMKIVSPAPPKRIAYNSLKLRHQQEENEDDPNSGLVKVPDLLKARPVAAAAPVAPVVAAPTTVALAPAIEDADVGLAPAAAVAKAVYRPAPKRSLKAKTVTAQVNAKPREFTKLKSVALVNPLTKEKFHVERVSLKPLPASKSKKVAFKTKHAKPAKLAAKKQSTVASVKHHAKAKLARAGVKKQANTRGVVTI